MPKFSMKRLAGGVMVLVCLGLAPLNSLASPEKDCQSVREWCEEQCTAEMDLESAVCAQLGFTPAAALCHSVKMVRYGGCLSECRTL